MLDFDTLCACFSFDKLRTLFDAAPDTEHSGVGGDFLAPRLPRGGPQVLSQLLYASPAEDSDEETESPERRQKRLVDSVLTLLNGQRGHNTITLTCWLYQC